MDAGVIAEALSQGGFEVAPPVTTQKDSKTFDSILEANWPRRGASDNRSNKTQRITEAPTPAEVSAP